LQTQITKDLKKIVDDAVDAGFEKKQRASKIDKVEAATQTDQIDERFRLVRCFQQRKDLLKERKEEGVLSAEEYKKAVRELYTEVYAMPLPR
jgi:hypothetical protein